MNVLRNMMLSLAMCAAMMPMLPAADLADQAHSLRLVPRTAAFYTASTRLREQLDAVAASNWWQRVQQVPVLQMGLIQAEQAWQFPPNDEIEQVKNWFESEQGQQIAALLADMCGDEIFLYGDSNITGLLMLAVELQSEMNSLNIEAGLDGEDEPDEEAIREFFRELIAKNKDKLVAPNLVMGFRIDKVDALTVQLDTLEQLLRAAMKDCPVPIEQHFKRIATSDHDLLVLELPSSLIPWSEVEDEIDDEEMYDLVRKTLDNKSLTVIVGRVGEFVVLSTGESAEHLTKLDQGEKLIDHKAIQKLTQHADERIVSIDFVSGAFLQTVNNNQKSLKDLASLGRQLLDEANITDDDRQKIAADIDALADDLLSLVPPTGDMSSVSFLTTRGYESFAYNWAAKPLAGDDKPLDVLQHMGKSPAAFAVSRNKLPIEVYDKIVEWCGRGLKNFEIIAVSESDADDWAKYLEVKKLVMPLVERLDQANRNELLPGMMAEGIGGIVLDLSVSEPTWCDFMSASRKPLPLPAVQMVMQVNDAEKVKSGTTEYYRVAQDFLDLLHNLEPGEVPEITLPRPNVVEKQGATIFEFPLDPSLGASTEILPHFAVSDSAAIVGYLPAATESLLESHTLQLGSPVAQFDRPLQAAVYCDFNRLLDATKLWIDYGFQYVAENELDESNMTFFVKPQLDQMLELARPIKSATAITYYEDGVWVTRSELHIEDF